jgi:hypothetical protein
LLGLLFMHHQQVFAAKHGTDSPSSSRLRATLTIKGLVSGGLALEQICLTQCGLGK